MQGVFAKKISKINCNYEIICNIANLIGEKSDFNDALAYYFALD